MSDAPLSPFSFIKTAECLSEDHELFDPEVETTIARLGLPYNMAMAFRVAQSNITEERRLYYIEEIKEKQKSVVKEQEELHRRFVEACNNLDAKRAYELELKEAQEKNNVIMPDEPLEIIEKKKIEQNFDFEIN